MLYLFRIFTRAPSCWLVSELCPHLSLLREEGREVSEVIARVAASNRLTIWASNYPVRLQRSERGWNNKRPSHNQLRTWGGTALTRWNIRSHHHCLWRLTLVSMIGEEGAVLESTERGATHVFGKTETQKGRKNLVATKQRTKWWWFLYQEA